MEVQALFLAQVPLPEGIDHQIVVQLLAQVLLLEGPQQPSHIGGSAIQRPIQRQYRAFRFAGAQPPGHITGAVAGGRHDLQDALFRGRGDLHLPRFAIEDKGNRGGRYIGDAGDVLDGCHSEAPFLCDSSILPKFARKVNSSRKA